MVVLLFFALALAAGFFILSPLFLEPLWPSPPSSPLSELRRHKRMQLWAIADIDDEYDMGKLNKSDHAALREYYKTELIAVIRQEKEMLGEYGAPRVTDIPRPLKERLLFEVTRICGRQRS